MGKSNRRATDEDLVALTKLLDHMVSSIVNNPKGLAIKCERGAHAVHLVFSVSQEDAKFVVGHLGANVEAIERILHAAARTRGTQVRVQFDGS